MRDPREAAAPGAPDHSTLRDDLKHLAWFVAISEAVLLIFGTEFWLKPVVVGAVLCDGSIVERARRRRSDRSGGNEGAP